MFNPGYDPEAIVRSSAEHQFAPWVLHALAEAQAIRPNTEAPESSLMDGRMDVDGVIGRIFTWAAQQASGEQSTAIDDRTEASQDREEPRIGTLVQGSIYAGRLGLELEIAEDEPTNEADDNQELTIVESEDGQLEAQQWEFVIVYGEDGTPTAVKATKSKGKGVWAPCRDCSESVWYGEPECCPQCYVNYQGGKRGDTEKEKAAV